MSPKRFQSLYNAQTSIARRVYDATPISEAWTVHQVMQELARAGLPIRDYSKVEGCLNSLRQAGLVDEPEKGKFRRAKVAPLKIAAVSSQPETIEDEPAPQMSKPTITVKTASSAPTEAKKHTNPLERLDELAKRARAAAATLTTLADEIDTVALEIEEEFEANMKAAATLRQLQALMRGEG